MTGKLCHFLFGERNRRRCHFGLHHRIRDPQKPLPAILSSDVEGVNSGTTATGSSITRYEMKRVDHQLGCEVLNGPVIIAYIHENGILGMYFLATFACILSFDAMDVRIYDQTRGVYS